MRIKAKTPSAVLLMLVLCASFSACKDSSRKDYNYYKEHADEARSDADQCKLNGTMGMVSEQIAQCDAARNALAARGNR